MNVITGCFLIKKYSVKISVTKYFFLYKYQMKEEMKEAMI